MSSVPCAAESFGQYDVVVLSTAHAAFRNPALYERVGILMDTRNAVKCKRPLFPCFLPVTT